MNIRSLFTGKPDGRGFAEDPASLARLYSDFEARCFERSGPLRDPLSWLWFPISNYLRALPLARRSRWGMVETVNEAYRFGESALGAVQLLDQDRVPMVIRRFKELPSHLRLSLFGKEVEDRDSDALVTIFRKAFRLAWTLSNFDETIICRQVDEDEFERLSRADVPTQLRIGAEHVDLQELASTTDRKIVQLTRRYDPNHRLDTASECQQVLEYGRCHLTAITKLVLGPKKS